MRDLITILVAVLGGGGATQLIALIVRAARQVRRESRDRETRVQAAEREARSWELVAVRTRRVAVEHRAPLDALPLGPGEQPLHPLDDQP